MDRYSRQIRLENFGLEGQNALAKAKVLIIGCGGLGSPAAMSLSRAGVMHLGLVDGDVVQLSNLHRQVLFTESDINELKVEATKRNLLYGDSTLTIETYPTRLNNENAEAIFTPYDIILDCTDNFDTRYLINDVCVTLNKPIVYGAANQLEGQLAVFNYLGGGNLRDIFPEIPEAGTIQNCEEAGVLGAITGIIGNMMALETIKIITGVGQVLTNKLVQYDGASNHLLSVAFKPQKTKSSQEVISQPKQISWLEFKALDSQAFTLVDVRTKEERTQLSKGGIHIPISELAARMDELNALPSIVFYCQSGQRAMEAARLFNEAAGRQASIAIAGQLSGK